MPSINEKGKYVNSKYSNSGATIINPPSSKRFPAGMYTKVFFLINIYCYLL